LHDGIGPEKPAQDESYSGRVKPELALHDRRRNGKVGAIDIVDRVRQAAKDNHCPARARHIFSPLCFEGKPLASKAAVTVVVGNRRFFFDAHQNLPF
jgi:hypothetical protein